MRGPALVCFAVVALAAPRARAAPDACGPSVRVVGDAEVAGAIRDSLAARGLAEVVAAACPSMQVVVARSGARLHVEVTDGYGRRSEREVRDSATAVALIESWARPEIFIGDDLPGAAPDAIAIATTPRPRPRATGLALLAGADRAGDGTSWKRAGAAGCVGVGPICVGARLELASPIDAGAHPRRATHLAATVELPRRFGRLALVPGVGVGGAWASVGGLGPHADQTEDETSLRVLATVAVRLAIAGRWAVELELGGEAEAISGTHAVPGNLGRAGLGLRYGGR